MFKTTFKHSLYSLVTLTLLASCSSTGHQKDLTRGTAITQSQLYEYCQDTAQDGKRYSFTGYFSLQEDIQLDRSQTVHLNLYTGPGGKGDLIYPVMMDFGKKPNQFYAPEKFTLSDLKVFDHTGKALSYRDKIQVSFTLDLMTDRARKRMIYFTRDDKGFPVKREVYAYPFVLQDLRIDKAL